MVDDTDSSNNATTGFIGGNIVSKPANCLRISSINPRGIPLKELEITLQLVIDLRIDVQCFSEVNLATNKNHIQQHLRQAVRKMDPGGRSTRGSSRIPSATDYKPSGMGIVSFGDHSGRIKETGNNSYGRWSYQIIDGKNNIDMLIISVYQCCKRPTNKIGGTAFHQ